MKIKLLVLLFLFLAVGTEKTHAQRTTQRLTHYFIAKKEDRTKLYVPGMKLTVFTNSKKIKGSLLVVNDSSIVLLRRNKPIEILVNDISRVRKRDPGIRIALGLAGSIAMVGGLILAENARAWGVAFAIPIVAAGSFSLIALPITSLSEILGEKKLKKGWQFKILKQRP
ncbi:MAG: hypothetical protein ACOYKE_04860 [Ferruginibacter sp.]